MILLLLIIFILTCSSVAIDSGFWYGETRPPNPHYESLPFANLTVKVNRPFQEGPGQNLLRDPFNTAVDLYTGNTINRQSFDTQFVLDMSFALGIDPSRVFVVQVYKGSVHFSWESTSVIVQFIFLERNNTQSMTLLEAIAELTIQMQQPKSKLFVGTNVTLDIDPQYGLQVRTWDISLKLSYAIEVVGGTAVRDGYFLNQGGLGICDDAGAMNFTKYCEFERFFEDDVSNALNISYYRVQVMFIKQAALDSVLVYFRILPPMMQSHEANVTFAVANLMEQVYDSTSQLYNGNVTIRVDPLWGVSNTIPTLRTQAPRFTLKYYEIDKSKLLSPKRMTLMSAYDRCKAVRRCNWGVLEHNQSTNDVRYFHRLFDRGVLYPTELFLDFQDWRLGSRGFSWTGAIPPTERGKTSLVHAKAKPSILTGAHFSPFDQRSLGPDIPCYLTERNQGLVLDRSLQRSQLDMQEALVDDLKGRIDWLAENIEWATMGPEQRARKDVRENLTWVKADFSHWWENEVVELHQLNSSQCVQKKCMIQFNTSSLELTGAIEDIGEIRTTKDGTEVAVFTFNSIYLGPEVEVRLVGQRAIALVSKTTAIINTTFLAHPGTIGGFQGGGSVARYPADQLSDTPRSTLICQLGNYCLDKNLSHLTFSNNVNGPGSGNLRINPFVIQSSATILPEIQAIRTTAQDGQTLAGGFTLHFNGYTTSIIPFDASSVLIKRIIETNLNLAPPQNAPMDPNRLLGGVAGVGLVNITRSFQDSSTGYTWLVTFTTAIGNIQQMTATSYLQGLNANVSVETVQQGNELGGSFQLEFQGQLTQPIAAYETAAGLKNILLQLPMVSTAYVTRIDPTQNCDDGLCFYGPHAGRGMVWTVYITTDLRYDDITPTSPTSKLALEEAPHYRITPIIDNLSGVGAKITITVGTAASPDDMMALLNVSMPFSLAFGGGGASYGGMGGTGYGETPVAKPYNDAALADLLGGSGGCMRSQTPFNFNALKDFAMGYGGHGGGAIEITASNDIIIGSYGKVIMRGGDGQQTSAGGGGGGSGGAILLAAGGTVVSSGLLDVTGGMGGYGGFGHLDWAGGGGGGGRVAVFGQSITTTGGRVLIQGGICGAYKIPVEVKTFVVNVTLGMEMLTPLNNERLEVLGQTLINGTLATMGMSTASIDNFQLNGTFRALLNLIVTLDASAGVNGSDFDALTTAFSTIPGTNIAEVMVFSLNITAYNSSVEFPTRAFPTTCSNSGNAGTYITEATMTTSMYVKSTNSAEGTSRGLFFSNDENTNTSSGSAREAPFSWNGPIMPFEPSQPTRITYYTRMDAQPGQSTKSNFGALFSLLSRGVPGLNVSSVIGVFIGYEIMHGANFGSAVDEKYFLKRAVTIDPYPTLNRWYKIDIHIDWTTNMYSVAIDDAIAALNASFTGHNVDGIRISLTRATNVWFDEIYVGFDNTMNFMCPTTTRQGTATMQPVQKRWSFQEVHGGNSNGYTMYDKMQRHYSHLDTTGSIPFDGQGPVSENQDIKMLFADGDYPQTQGLLHAGALVYLTNSLRSAKTATGASSTLVSPSGLWYQPPDGIGGAGDGRQFWYTEYNYLSNLTNTMNGGVAACSSQDLTTWRFEGIVFHYANLTEMVFGTPGAFYVERPKVKWNAFTSSYVMWAVMDDANRTFAMNAIMSSPYEDGPFYFRRSFYPDGNTTRDQVIFVNDENLAVLGRTYYQTVEFVLPDAIMQPTWESAKTRNGTIDFATNYHRAVYASGYDNYHDIYNQRWRKEDVAWDVQCVNKITNEIRNVPAGTYNAQGTVCNDPIERKVIIGQGNPIIRTKFITPESSDNSWWMQTSVPAVKAQPWASSYRDGYCGIRLLNDGMSITDPDLASFVPNDRSSCSNIGDNPVHEALRDKLIGVLRVVTTRRAKFMAISELTDDFLDTTGNLNSFEGELESGDLISMIIEMGQFGFGAGKVVRSTFAAPVRSEFDTAVDYKIRLRQYVRNFNDRATYSLACVLDGVCPVNFKDEINL